VGRELHRGNWRARRHAAKRPSPLSPSAARGSLLKHFAPVETHLPDGFIMVFSPVKMNIEDISGQNEQGHAARDQ